MTFWKRIFGKAEALPPRLGCGGWEGWEGWVGCVRVPAAAVYRRPSARGGSYLPAARRGCGWALGPWAEPARYQSRRAAGEKPSLAPCG